MHPIPTEDIPFDAPSRPWWHALRDLAASIAVVSAVALIAAFLAVTA